METVQNDHETLSSPMENEADPEFYPAPQPILLPKSDIGISDFLRSNPTWDGRNVVIAILDTGVDPAAWGCQVTSTGHPKIIDIANTSGAGDIDTSTVRSPDSNGILLGLSGRKLKIPAGWTNPCKKYHLGVTDVYGLYPKLLKERISKERKEKWWDPLHREVYAEATRALDKFQSNESDIDRHGKWKREEYEARLEILGNVEKKFNYCGPVFDCVVFHDGSAWKVCVDTTEKGKLEKCPLLSNYSDAREYARFSDDDMCTYSVNVRDNGNLLEIVTTCGAHGTHVASIAAGNFPLEPERNGLAPGAQVLALSVGDNRLGSMETGASLLRAIDKAIQMKVDLINYSYGEACHWPNAGRVIRAIEDAVYKHGIIFVSSAGNNGPCLSTVGAPGGTTSACIGVAAYLTTDMARHLHSLRDDVPHMLYPWSSRGPTADGHLGVSVSAPGGAIASIPHWTLKSCQLQNGTSMSSPSACGGIACLLSALKAEKIPYSPWSIKRALEMTAKKPAGADMLSVGHGLLQIPAAFEYCKKFGELLEPHVRYVILVDKKYRGIYLREHFQMLRPREVTISVEPIFSDDCPNCRKVDFHKRLRLTCSVDWIRCPDTLELTQDREFVVEVDPTGLAANVVHCTEILAIDSAFPSDIGPLWRVPVTVIVPEVVQDTVECKLQFSKVPCEPAQYHRHFIHVPEGADWAVLKFQSHDSDKASRFVFHAMQVLPQKSYRTTESYKVANLTSHGETTQAFAVVGGRTLEVCITKWWSSLGEIHASYSIEFHGLQPSNADTTMLRSDQYLRLDVKSTLKHEKLNPSISLKYLHQPLRPVEHHLAALSTRDVFASNRSSYELVLTYQFSVSKAGEVQPYCALLSEYLYEMEFQSQLWMIFTSKKQFLFAGEAYPWRYATKLEQGDYTMLLQLRHDERDFLENLKEMPVIIQYKLQSPINLDVYASHTALMTGKKFWGITVAPNVIVPLFLAPPASDKIPKAAGVGWYLTGKISYPKSEFGRKASQFPIRYVLTDGPCRKRSDSISPTRADCSQMDYADAVRDLRISWLPKLEDSVFMDQVFEELKGEPSVSALSLYSAHLKALSKDILNNAERIIESADCMLNEIDADELFKFFGVKTHLDESAPKKSDMEKRKTLLLEALVGKGLVYAESLIFAMEDMPPSARTVVPTHKDKETSLKKEKQISKGSNQDQECDAAALTSTDNTVENDSCIVEDVKEEKSLPEVKDVDDIFVNIVKWVDAMDAKVIQFSLKHALVHRHWGRALIYLSKMMDDKPSKDNEQLAIEIYRELGWLHVMKYHKDWLLVKYPPSYRLF